MARPRKDSGGIAAKEALVEAFWSLLAQRPYAKITVKELSAAAGLNHNTFYYHFENMDDLARQAIDATVPQHIIRAQIPRLLGETHPAVELPLEEIAPRFERVKLFAKPDSPRLHPVIRNILEHEWTSAIGLDLARLSPMEQASLSFLSAGGVAVVGSNPDLTVEDLQTLLNGPVGIAARAVLKAVLESHGKTAAQQS